MNCKQLLKALESPLKSCTLTGEAEQGFCVARGIKQGVPLQDL